jgi:hypothetical protein
MSTSTYSTVVQMDLNYPSYGTTNTVVRAVSLTPTFNFNTSTYIAQIADPIGGLSPGNLSNAVPSMDGSSATFTIPSLTIGSNYDNSLCVIKFTINGQDQIAGLFLCAPTSPLSVLPLTASIGDTVTVTEDNTITIDMAIDLVFSSPNLIITPVTTPPYLAYAQINSNVTPTGPYTGTTLTDFTPTATAKTFSFKVPVGAVNGTNNILITYNFPGTDVSGDFPMNIGTFTVEGSSPVICFKEDSKILCIKDDKEQELPIQDLKEGTLVKTLYNGFLPVKVIGKSTVYNSGNNERIKDRLYKLSKNKYPELNDDLYITGLHSILTDHITATQEEDIKNIIGKIYVTDKKYRLIACADEKAEPYTEEGIYNIYHIALGDDKNRNYGIYANGLLVESCFEITITKCMRFD